MEVRCRAFAQRLAPVHHGLIPRSGRTIRRDGPIPTLDDLKARRFEVAVDLAHRRDVLERDGVLQLLFDVSVPLVVRIERVRQAHFLSPEQGAGFSTR